MKTILSKVNLNPNPFIVPRIAISNLVYQCKIMFLYLCNKPSSFSGN